MGEDGEPSRSIQSTSKRQTSTASQLGFNSFEPPRCESPCDSVFAFPAAYLYRKLFLKCTKHLVALHFVSAHTPNCR